MEQIHTGTRASGETSSCLWISLITVCVLCQEQKQRFLKTFIRDLRRNDKASEMKILNMMNEVNKISRVKIKRSAGEKYHKNIINTIHQAKTTGHKHKRPLYEGRVV